MDDLPTIIGGLVLLISSLGILRFLILSSPGSVSDEKKEEGSRLRKNKEIKFPPCEKCGGFTRVDVANEGVYAVCVLCKHTATLQGKKVACTVCAFCWPSVA